jgi:hypothetical protein
LRLISRLLSIMAIASAPMLGQDDPAHLRADAAILQAIESAPANEKLITIDNALKSLSYRLADPERYARTVYSAFLLLSEGDVRNPVDTRTLEQRYCLAALDRPDRLKADTELRLVIRLRATVASAGATMPDHDGVHTKMTLLFHAWRRMEQELDPAFQLDFAHMPVENVSPPSGSGGISGIPPELISDSRLRNEYLAAIEENRKKTAIANLQVGLRNLREPFLRHAEQFLLAAIKAQSISTSEVVSSLNLIQDEKARQRVLLKVESAATR